MVTEAKVFEVRGWQDIDKKLSRFSLKSQVVLASRACYKAASYIILPAARMRVPRRTGQLGATLRAVRWKTKFTGGASVRTKEPRIRGKYYGGIVEHGSIRGKGTKKTIVQPQPFLSPAGEENVQPVGLLVGHELRRQFKQLAKRRAAL